MRDAIIAGYDSDWTRLVESCLAPPPRGKRVFYQKHMTHHVLKGFDRSWVLGLTNAFLIRRPERVLASYTKKWADVSLRDIGFVEQAEIFDLVADRLGHAPAVIDADDVLADPRGVLSRLCRACGIPFDDHMLSWPKGPKSFDGLWAPYWYNTVWESTGFAKPDERPIELNSTLAAIADEARPHYERLQQYRL
jgi:hypothetical protein